MKRQGDLVIKQVNSIPLNAKLQKDGVLVYGEATGHAHRLVGGNVFKTDNGMIFLKVEGKASIKHEEHKPISLNKGLYGVIRQREYLKKDMTTLVID